MTRRLRPPCPLWGGWWIRCTASPIRPSAPSPAGGGREPAGDRSQCSRQIALSQTALLPLAGEGGAQRRMRGNRMRLSWSRRSDVAPIRPSGTFPRRRGKGALSDGGGTGESEFAADSPAQALCSSLRAAARASLLTSTPPSMRANSSWRACGPSSSTALWVMPSTGALLTR